MRKTKWISRIAAVLLCTAMAGQSLVMPVYAAEIEETETEFEMVYESSKTEDSVPAESESMEKDAIEDIEDVSVPEAAAETYTETSAAEIYTETEAEDETGLEEPKRITGFISLPEEERTRSYSYNGKPSEEEVAADLPETLEVYLDGGDSVSEIPVTWKGIGDYDETDYHYYEFDPVWDEASYILDTNDDIPYIGVYLDTPQMRSVSGNENETIIYDYLREEMGLNMAAACGVLANIKCESDFNPNMEGDYVDGVYTSYGICQWHGDRLTALQNFTDEWQTLEGQLEYLKYELSGDYSKILSYLMGVSDDADGAYDAAYYWCYNFEIPADTANTSVSRGNLARDTYWPYYSSGNVVISDYTYPGTLKEGDSFSIKGQLSSETNITSVTVGVYDAAGDMQIGKTVSPNSTSYSLSNVDADIKFGTLSSGVYRYKVTAKNDTGTATLVDEVFIVLAKGSTIADGTYYIRSATDINYMVSIKSDSNAEGANAHLWKYADTNYMRFTFEYQSDGYYQIKNVGSGKYLGVAGQSGASGANVEQQADGTLWQVLTDGSKYWYLVPKCATTCCFDLSGNTIANGTNIDISSANMTTAQRWKLDSKVEATKPAISGATTPGTMTKGSSFDIRGTISSDSTITSVTVGVYDVSGNMKIGKTVSPNASSYDLKNVDTSIKFGSLAAGVYRYKVTADNDAGTTTLVNKVFVVLETEQTVSNGTYNIASMTNTGYVLSIKSDSKEDGANVHLWTKATTNFMKFQFTYDGNGYYKIKDVGSGKYLGVTNQSSSSGANVEQQSGGTLWQVLPDGTGAYYIVPKSASGCCLDLSGNQVERGRNIDIYTANMTTAQRWKLESVSDSQKATISGATTPGTMTKGSSFDIRGTISSDSTITSVTVGVYDVKGNMKIGKTVSPNSNSYDLKNVDTSIKFGSLAAGVYRYKVTADNSAGTATLVNKVFVILETGQTVSNGTYNIVSMTNTDYVLSIKSDSNAAGANVHLWKKTTTNYMKFQFTYNGDGYYKIKDVGSGKYLGVTDQSSSSGANVEQQSGGTLWQVLPDGTGAYYIVPKSAKGCCMDLAGNQIENGRNIDIYTANMTTAQRWKLQ